MKWKQDWPTWQAMLVVLLISVFARHGPPKDAAHAKAGAFLRLGVVLIVVIGFLIIHRAKRKAASEPVIKKRVPRVAPGDRAVRITYESTREAYSRCSFYVVTHCWFPLLTIFTVSLAFTVVFSPQFYQLDPSLAFFTIPLSFVVTFAAWTLFLLFTHWIILEEKFPVHGRARFCTSSLTAAGFHDVMPEGVKLTEWGQVRAVRLHKSDIFILTLDGGPFIPHTAFRDEDAARQFYLVAVTLWRSKGTVWPAEAVA